MASELGQPYYSWPSNGSGPLLAAWCTARPSVDPGSTTPDKLQALPGTTVLHTIQTASGTFALHTAALHITVAAIAWTAATVNLQQDGTL
jgi:hypothetical protein